jgi:hypothetical protein
MNLNMNLNMYLGIYLIMNQTLNCSRKEIS